ncbi:MAG: hypothetical protein R2705_25720, partial [Ilumatobacteraceae bacterium]
MTNPTGFHVRRSTATTRAGFGVFALAALALATVPFTASGSTETTLTELLFYLGLAQMWNLVAGYAGLLSIGQQAWVGL